MTELSGEGGPSPEDIKLPQTSLESREGSTRRTAVTEHFNKFVNAVAPVKSLDVGLKRLFSSMNIGKDAKPAWAKTFPMVWQEMEEQIGDVPYNLPESLPEKERQRFLDTFNRVKELAASGEMDSELETYVRNVNSPEDKRIRPLLQELKSAARRIIPKWNSDIYYHTVESVWTDERLEDDFTRMALQMHVESDSDDLLNPDEVDQTVSAMQELDSRLHRDERVPIVFISPDQDGAGWTNGRGIQIRESEYGPPQRCVEIGDKIRIGSAIFSFPRSTVPLYLPDGAVDLIRGDGLLIGYDAIKSYIGEKQDQILPGHDASSESETDIPYNNPAFIARLAHLFYQGDIISGFGKPNERIDGVPIDAFESFLQAYYPGEIDFTIKQKYWEAVVQLNREKKDEFIDNF